MNELRLIPAEILLYAKQGESFTVEFKRAVSSKVRELSEEICAFANSEGGYLFIGIMDDGNICGCDISNSKRSAIQNSINEISPAIDCDFYSVEVESKNVWVIEVPLVEEDKPYFVSGAVYVRQNSNSQKLTDRDMIRKMFVDSVQISFDKISAKDYKLDEHIDRGTMREFRLQSGISDVVTDRQILENMSVYKDGLPLNAAVMFFGDNQNQLFMQAVTRCVMFKGTTKVHIIDDKTFDGTLLSQYENAYKWLQSKISVKYIMEGFNPRKEIWELPLSALKEGLLNAICHRDYYDTGANITVEVYDDRVTITNPGGVLPIVQKNFGHISKTRNPLIFGLFTRMHLVEKVGSGIPRMAEAMESLNLREPELNYDNDFYSITFWKNTSEIFPEKQNSEEDDTLNSENDTLFSGNDTLNQQNDTLFSEDDTLNSENDTLFSENDTLNPQNDTLFSEDDTLNSDQKIVSLLKQKNNITQEEIADLLGISVITTKRIMEKLQKQKIIQRVGSKKTGSWQIINGGEL